jgi:hypothetical protein
VECEKYKSKENNKVPVYTEPMNHHIVIVIVAVECFSGNSAGVLAYIGHPVFNRGGALMEFDANKIIYNGAC